MTGEAAIAFVMGALGAQTTTEPTRLAFEGALSSLLTGNFYGIPSLLPGTQLQSAALYNDLNSAIDDSWPRMPCRARSSFARSLR